MKDSEGRESSEQSLAYIVQFKHDIEQLTSQEEL